jgi:Tol biopolymer transport system component
VRNIVGIVAAATGCLILAAAAPARRSDEPHGTIVFQRIWTNPLALQVFAFQADGAHVRAVTRGPARVDRTEPDVSPDGLQVTMQSGPHDGRTEVYTVDIDGRRWRRLTRCTTCHWTGDPSFSADGRSIVYAREEGSGVVGIWRMHADGRGQKLIFHARRGHFADQPTLSPDGSALAYRSGPLDNRGTPSIYVARADGSHAQRVTPVALYASGPRWSPDGKWLVFYTTDRDHLRQGVSANIEVVRPDGTGLHALTHDRGGSVQDYEPSWSPDGRWIVFARELGANHPPGAHAGGDIYVMRGDGSDMRRILGVGSSDDWPRWGR